MKHAELLTLQERITAILEKRFFSAQDVLFDYAGMNGEVILPTPEECGSSKPNGLSWHAPVSNGAFFNGSLLTAAVRIWELYPSEKLAAFARKLLKGLFALQDLSPVPAFICRGFGSDGKCCYLSSSNDQIVPWLLGVREFSRSALSTPAEKADCRRRMLELLIPLRELNWRIPGLKPGFERGDLLHKGPFDACHVLLAALILEEEGNEKGLVKEMLKDRFEVLQAGYSEIRPGECWYASHNFDILRLLKSFFADSEYKEAFSHGLRVTAKACLKALDEWKKRVPDNPFTPDWHCMNSVWFEQNNSADALKCASLQGKIWRANSPAVLDERCTTMASLSAAWIIMISEDEEIIRSAGAAILEALEKIPYEKLYHSSMFFAVNVISELLRYPEEKF